MYVYLLDISKNAYLDEKSFTSHRLSWSFDEKHPDSPSSIVCPFPFFHRAWHLTKPVSHVRHTQVGSSQKKENKAR